MRVIFSKKEEGIFGTDGVIAAITWFTMAVASMLIMYWLDVYLVHAAWVGVVTEMQPGHLYPSLLSNGLPHGELIKFHGSKSLFYGAIWLQQNIVIRYMVNALFLFLLLMIGIAYMYYDLFEQYLNTKLRTFIPRIVFGIILAYMNVYILQALMQVAEGGYLLFYNLGGPLGAWRDPNFMIWALASMGNNGNFGINSGIPGLDQLAGLYIKYIWVFIAGAESVSILILVSVRDFMLALLIVLLPIASLMLVHPWTQRIGSRLWWLAIDLIFLPIVMVIPLMLMGLVENSISFMVAGLAMVIGSIYLISQEPFVLNGAGFTRAGGMLSGGIQGGMMSGGVVGGLKSSAAGAMNNPQMRGKLGQKIAGAYGGSKASLPADGGSLNNAGSELKGGEK